MKTHILTTLLCAAVFEAHAQSTAFTYHGRLAASGSPYTGFAEMQFALFSAPTGGTAIAVSAPAIASVNVSSGLFATSLDFGAAAFPGADRWLEVQVRTNLGAFSTLTPRQPMTPTPYAGYARTAGTALGPWVTSGADLAYTDGKVGIGTTTPAAGLHIKKEAIPPGGTLALEGNTHTYLTLFPDGLFAGRKGYFGFASSGTHDITIGNEYSDGRVVLFSPKGAHFAAAGDENLRIVRGTFSASGVIEGSGFSVSRSDVGTVGEYIITYDIPFAGIPSVTATPVGNGGDIEHILETRVGAATEMRIDVFRRDDGHHADTFVHFIAIGPR